MNKQRIFSVLAVLTLCLTGCGNANNTSVVSTKPAETAATEAARPTEKKESEKEEKTEETVVTEIETEAETEATTLSLAEMIVTPSDEEFETEYDYDLQGTVITKYNGEAVSVLFPTKINGEIITAINVSENKSLRYIEIPEGITSFCFKNCENLEEAVLPENLTEIPKEAFMKCEKLTSINIPDNIKIINEYAFNCCKSLTTINLPENLNEIGKMALANCHELKTLKIPEKEITIGTEAFARCYSLEEIEIPAGFNVNDQYGEYTDYFKECNNLKSAIIHNSCATGLLSGCASLEKITLISDDNSDFIIKNRAFAGCTKLNNVDITNCNLTKIDGYAFNNCDNLLSFDLPDDIAYIAQYAFNGCSRLTVTYKGNEYNSSNFYELYNLFSE